MIKNLTLKNFTNFKSLDIEFSPGVNVIIGENGTGKTHLLKAAYGLCSGNAKLDGREDVTKEDISNELTNKLLSLFMPLDGKLGKLRRTGTDISESSVLSATVSEDRTIDISFHSNSKSVAVQNQNKYVDYSYCPVFIPTKEVLSFMKGFISLYQKYELSFDATFHDICLQLDLPEIRKDQLHERSKWAIKEIEKVCGGKFIFYGGGKVTFRTEDAEYSANVMAEGFRKAGMLARLLETGALMPGVSGPLIWDEPEANLNPKLLKLLVQILLNLSTQGQQVIISTHNYVLLKWFNLLAKKSEGHDVSYHSLTLNPETKEVQLQSSDDFSDIQNNPIDEAFESIINEEIQNEIGEL
jgi:predicted ATP-dependent endonuclease of OLD family